MRHLKLLIWNDKVADAKAWKQSAEDDGFQRIELTSTSEVEDVVKQYLAWRPDVTILDLWDTRSNKALGRKIAQEIHRRDPLAALIAVTTKPAEAYVADGYLRWHGFSGVYPAKLMDTRYQFRDVVIAESLVVKHLMQPEYVLARQASLSLLSRDWGKAAPLVNTLVATIQRLPFSGPIDGWHRILASGIEQSLRDHSWNRLADRYRSIATLFERSDPFYMAGSKSRRHLSHNVQVCLLGLCVLLGSEPVTAAAEKQTASLFDAVLIWLCIGTVHDAAYLSQFLEPTSKELMSIGQGFSAFVPSGTTPAWSWPALHHAEVGAKMWEDTANDAQGNASRAIASGILDHDSKRPGASRVTLDESWQSFLAVLCDELQDWQRFRTEAGPGIDSLEDVPWRLFEPVQFEAVSESQDTSRISLEFLVVDHPIFVQDHEGKPNIAPIQKRFLGILNTLEHALCSSRRIQVDLTAHFITRDNVAPVYQTRQLKTTP